jgi:hypothetical protein
MEAPRLWRAPSMPLKNKSSYGRTPQASFHSYKKQIILWKNAVGLLPFL